MVVKVLSNAPFRWYAFPNFRTQISRPLAYSVHISSEASATAAYQETAAAFLQD